MISVEASGPGDLVPEASSAWMRCSVGPELLALPISAVQEVISGQRVEPDPRAPSGILGVVPGPKGRIPVIDLAEHLALLKSGPADAEAAEGYVLIVAAKGRQLGLAVSSVFGLVELALDRMRPLPPASRSANSRELLGAYPWEDRWLLLVDAEELVSVATGS